MSQAQTAREDLDIPDEWDVEVDGEVIRMNAPRFGDWKTGNPPGVDVVFTRSGFQTVMAVGPKIKTHYADTFGYEEAVEKAQEAIDELRQNIKMVRTGFA